MRKFITLAAFLITTTVSLVSGQTRNQQVESWEWIEPLKTDRITIEAVFGDSITTDKLHPFQTYKTCFGKINIAYSEKSEFIPEFKTRVNAGTVLHIFVTFNDKILLKDLNQDIGQYARDGTFEPREVSYFNAKLGLMIVTEIVTTKDGVMRETVIAIKKRPAIISR